MSHKGSISCALAGAVGISLALSGCRPAATTPQVEPATQTAQSTLPAATNTKIPARPVQETSPAVPNQAVLSACDQALQGKAMRSEYLPDWTALEVDTCYDLAFDLTSGGPDYSGTALITYTNPSQFPIPDLVLRLYPNSSLIYGGRLEINSANVDGSALVLTEALSDRTAVQLVLPQALASGGTLTLKLAFTGTLPVDFGSEQTYGIFNYTRTGPVLMMANAYPMLAPRDGDVWRAEPVSGGGDAVISETALHRVAVTAPADWKIVSSGSTTGDSTQGGVRTTNIASGPVREFFLAASPALNLQEETLQDLHIQHWGLAGTEPAWDETMQTAHNALELFEEKFGPYPYRELDIISTPLNNASGVEYPGLILIGKGLYTNPDQFNRLTDVVAHEVAHQWWYGLVGSDILLHPWQDEALATFSAQLYEQAYNPGYYFGAQEFYRQRVKQVEDDLGTQKVDQPVTAFNSQPGAYSAIVYLKGSLFFEAVREEIGDAEFLAALQDYYQLNQYQEASPDNLLDSFETSCSCKLDRLYEEWGVVP